MRVTPESKIRFEPAMGGGKGAHDYVPDLGYVLEAKASQEKDRIFFGPNLTTFKR